MSLLPWVHGLHLVAAAIWLGGTIALGVMVGALRREGVERHVLQSAARSFGRVSWSAMVIAIGTGVAQVELMHMPWQHRRLVEKLVIVGVTIVVALVHVRTARQLRGGARAVMEVGLLVLSLLIFAAAVRL